MSGLLLDEMYSRELARLLRQRGHDVVAVLDPDIGLVAAPDTEVLAWAARNGRCLVTENARDFVRLAPGIPHLGVVLVSGQRFRRTPSGLGRLVSALDQMLSGKDLPPPDGMVWLGAVG